MCVCVCVCVWMREKKVYVCVLGGGGCMGRLCETVMSFL